MRQLSPVIILIFALALCTLTSYGQLSGYSFYKSISIQNDKVIGTADHINFPILINHTDPDIRSVANGGKVENINGYDIRFTSSDGATLLDHELEYYNGVSGSLTIWVKIPVLSSSANTTIYMHYGNASISTNSSISNVWDNYYKGVWHLNNNNLDGTSNSNHLTPSGTVNEPIAAISGGQTFSINESLNGGIQTELQILGDLTIEAWVNLNNIQSGDTDNVLLSCGMPSSSFVNNNNYKLNITQDSLIQVIWNYGIGNKETSLSTVSAPILIGNWHHITVSREVSSKLVTFYFDGIPLGATTTYSNNPDGGSAGEIWLGEQVNNQDITGSLDEVRISNTLRSSDWIETSYNTMSDPSTFYTLSTQYLSPPDFCWAKDAPGSDDNIFESMATNPISGISYAVGFFKGNLSNRFTEGYNGTPDMSSTKGDLDGLVTKYDASGNPIWAFNIGEASESVWIKGVEIGANENIFITGFFNDRCNFKGTEGSSEITLTSATLNEADAFLASYDKDGKLLWVVKGSNTGVVESRDIAVNDSNVYITGWFENTLTFEGAPVMTALDGIDAFVVAYDHNGNFLWQSRIGDNTGNGENDLGYAIAADNKDVYVSGEFSRTIQFDNASATLSTYTPGVSTIFIAEYDAVLGTVNWADATGSDKNCSIRGLDIDNNRIFLAGSCKGSMIFPGIGPTRTISSNRNELLFSCYDRATGYTIWNHIYENNSFINARTMDVITDGLGLVYFTGSHAGTTQFNDSLDPKTSLGNSDFFITSIKDDGTYNWTLIGTDGNDITGHGLGYDDFGGIYACGEMESQASFGSLPILDDSSGQDAFITKINCDPCNASFAYSKTNFCKAIDTDPTPTGSYDPLGFFTSTPSGLNINPNNGQITLASSASGEYFITYTSPSLCTEIDTIIINDNCWEWMDTPNSNGSERGLSIAIDSINQFVYVVGTFNNDTAFSSLPIGQINSGAGNGESDGFLAKYNFSGTQLWITNMGGTAADKTIGVTVGPLGNIYITGFFKGSMYFYSAGATPAANPFGANGIKDMFTACYNSSGNYQWSARGGGAGNMTSGHEITSNIDGIYIVGTYQNSASFGAYSTETTFNTTTNAYVLKYNFSGIEQWLIELKSDGDDYDNTFQEQELKYDITSDNDSFYIIGEYGGSNLRFTNTTGTLLTTHQLWNINSYKNIFYSSFSSNGMIGWVNQIQTMSDAETYGYGIATDCGGVYITGSIHSGDSISGTVITSNDHDNAFIAGLTKNNGQVKWTHMLGSNKDHLDVGHDIIADGYGNVAVIGTFESDPFHTPTANLIGATNSELFLSSFDNNGSFQWVKRSNGLNYEIGNSIANWGKDKFFITGAYDRDVSLTPYTSSTVSDTNLIVAGIAIVNPGSLLSNGPVITACKNDTLITNGTDCYILLGDFTGDIDYTGGCGAIAITQSPEIGDSIYPGIDTVWVYATDAHGKIDSCSFELTVADTTSPSITCPGNVHISCPTILNSIAPLTKDDNCGIDSLKYNLSGAASGFGLNDASGRYFDYGITTIVYTAIDSSGNITSCDFIIEVLDTIDPTIICPNDINTTTDFGNCTAVVNGIAPILPDDNCAKDSVSFLLSGKTLGMGLDDASGLTFFTGSTTVTYTVTDSSGNTGSCSFKLMITETEAPKITCPADVNKNTDPGLCSALINNIAPLDSSDNCNVDHISYVLTGATVTSGLHNASGLSFNKGTTFGEYIATDFSGNTNSCNFMVVVIDNEDPGISCPNDTAIYTSTGFCSAILTGIDAIGPSDNCGDLFSLNYQLTGATNLIGTGNASGTKFELGKTIVHYSATDSARRDSFCMFEVEVLDTIRPNLNCPANITLDADLGSCSAVVNGIGPIGPSDICKIDSVSYILSGKTINNGLNDASGKTFNLGETEVIYSATDLSGNINSCSFTVKVVDKQTPTIGCPNDTTTFTDIGTCTAIVNGIAPSASDNCGALYSLNYELTGATNQIGLNDASSLRFELGTTQVDYKALDSAGLQNSCHFTITVLDTTKPIITCPKNLTVNSDSGSCDAIVNNISAMDTTDNCNIRLISYDVVGATQWNGTNDASGKAFGYGINTVSYLIEDESGNQNSCSFNITVVDAEKPTITCASNIIICDTNVIVPNPLTSDNCFVKTIFNDFNSTNNASGIYPYGVTTVNFTVSDSAGNQNNCAVNITVETMPSVNAGNDQTLIDTDFTNFNATAANKGIGTWSNLSGFGNILDINDPLSFVNELNIGENIFEWKVSYGSCPEAIDNVIINVIPLAIPNGFSPNGDGNNDFFVVEGLNFLQNELTIFNRWGVKLFNATNYQNDWDGKTNSGKKLPEDTYFYTIKIAEIDKELSGFVVLKK